MTYEMNDLKGLLILVLFSIPAITSTNINCRGKAFHCVNSTHFMICVDLGGGVSTTIDDFVIQCPPTTVCHERNIFECEFPRIEVTTPALHVIGVSKQSDISVTASVMKSVTTAMPLVVTTSVKENTTKSTSPRAEEVIFAPKWEVLESLKEPIGIKNESSTEGTTTLQVSPNSTNNENNIVNVEQVNDNRQEFAISIVDDKFFESAVESSVDKAVTASLTDKYKSIDTATLANGIIDLMYNNSEAIVDTTSNYEFSFVNNNESTADQNISKQVINTEKITENFTKLNETTFTNNTYKTAQLNYTTPLVFITTQSFDQDDINKQTDYSQLNYSDNKNILIINSDIYSEMSTTEVPKTYTTFITPTKTEFIKKPETISESPRSTTDKVFNQTSDKNLTNFYPPEIMVTTNTNELINLYQNDIKHDKAITYDYNIATKYPAPARNISLTEMFIENVTESGFTPTLATKKDKNYISIVGTAQNEPNTFIMEEIKNKSTAIPIIDDFYVNVKPDSSNITLQLDSFSNESTGNTTEVTAASTTNNSNLKQTSHENVINQNFATTVTNDGNNTAIGNHHTSIPDILIDQATESALIPIKRTEFVTLLNESNTVTKVEESKHELPAMSDTSDQNKLGTFVNSTISHNNVTAKSSATIENQTLLLDIFTVESSDIASDMATHSTSKNVINNQENKNQDTFVLQVLLDKLNVEKNAEITSNLDNYEKNITVTILPTTFEDPITGLVTDLSNNVNLDSHKNKTYIDLGKISPRNTAPQSTPQTFTLDYYNIEITTTAPVTLNTTTVSTNATKQLTIYPEIAENIKSTTGHEIEINVTSVLDVTHKTKLASTSPAPATLNMTTMRINDTTQFENTPDIIEDVKLNRTGSLSLVTKDKIFITELQKLTATDTTINTDSSKQVNTDHLASKLGTDFTSSVSTEKYTDVYISDQKYSMQDRTISPETTLDQYQEFNISTTIQPVFGNNVNISTTTYEVNTHKDDNVNIKPLLEANNPLVLLPGVISTLSSLNTDSLINAAENNLTSPSVIDDYVKTTASYTDMKIYTTTTSNNSMTNIQTQQTIGIIAEKQLINLEINQGKTEQFEKIRTENVKDISSTQTPLGSIGELDNILPGSNTTFEHYLTTEKIKLPNVKLGNVTPVNSDTNSINKKLFISTVSPLNLKTSVIKPSTEESIKTTTTAPMTRSTPVTLTQNTNGGLKTYFEELPTATTEVIETQTVYQDSKLFSEPTVTAAPLSTFKPEPQLSALSQKTLTNFGIINKITIVVTESPSMVENIESNVTETSGPFLGDLISGEIIKKVNSTNIKLKENEDVNGVVFDINTNITEIPVNTENVNLKISNDQVITSPKVPFNKIVPTETTNKLPNINSDIELPNISQKSVNTENSNLKITNDQIKTTNVFFYKIVPVETTTNLPIKNIDIKLQSISNTPVKNENGILKIINDQIKTAPNVSFNKIVPNETTTSLPNINSDIQLQNKLSTDKIGLNDATTVKLKYIPIALTTSAFYTITTESGLPGYTTQKPEVITAENVTKSSINTKIKLSDMIQTQQLTSLTSVSRNDNINCMKTNSTNNTQMLNEISGQNRTLSNKSQQHPKETNPLYISEIRTKSNATGNQINTTTSNVEKLNNTNLNNSNKPLNTNNKHNFTVNTGAYSFNCSNYTRGKYANKNDCRKFYTCVGNRVQPIVGICPNNTVFSEINKQCTRNLSHCVRNNQFRCLLEGRFSDFFKDNIYYICVKNSQNHFLRYKLQCQNNYHLDKATVKCVENVEISNLSASSVSENSKVNNDELESPNIVEKSTKATSYDFECEDEGKYANSNDCRKYYVCTKTSTGVYRRKIKQCSSEEVYNKEKQECVESDSCES